MTTKAIKISDNNYRWLSSMAGELQQERGEPVSIDEALSALRGRTKISDLAGTWTMSDSEAKHFQERLRKGWKQWRLESV